MEIQKAAVAGLSLIHISLLRVGEKGKGKNVCTLLCLALV